MFSSNVSLALLMVKMRSASPRVMRWSAPSTTSELA